MRLAHNKKKDFINQSELIIWCKKNNQTYI